MKNKSFNKFICLILGMCTLVGFTLSFQFTPHASAQVVEGKIYRNQEPYTYIAGTQDFIQVDSLDTSYIALKNDGTVYTFSTSTSSFVQVPGLTDVTQVSAGLHHYMAIKSDGTAWSWGRDRRRLGILGLGSAYINATVTTPLQIPFMTNVTKIEAGTSHSALIANGQLYTWGANVYEWLGFDHFIDEFAGILTSPSTCSVSSSGIRLCHTPTNTSYAAVDVALGSATNLDSNDGGTIFVRPNGTVGFFVDSDLQPDVGLTGVTKAFTNPYMADEFYVINNSGNVYSWGQGSSTGLGRNSAGSDSIPALVPNISNVIDIGIQATAGYVVALTSNGTIYYWGQAGFANGNVANFTPIQYPFSEFVLDISSNPSLLISGSQPTPVPMCGLNNPSVITSSTNTNVCLEVITGALTIYAGDNTNNNDICTKDNITNGDTIETNNSNSALSSVVCTGVEDSAVFQSLSVASSRQNTLTYLDDIIYEDLRGVGSASYTITATASNLVSNSTTITLGSNPDNASGDLDPEAPTNANNGKLFMVIDPSAGTLEALRPGSAIAQGTSNYSVGASTTILDPNTTATLFYTTANVISGRTALDHTRIQYRIPAFPVQDTYTSVVVVTVV
jgi:alpha-tubulin suppressor-like RCC1 family protein